MTSQSDISNHRPHPKNIIYYGVPGTGKTHQLQQLMQQYTQTLTTPSNFAQNLLNNLNWRDVIILVLLEQNRLLKVQDIAQHRFVLQKNALTKNANIVSTITNQLYRFSDPNSKTITRDNINHASQSFFDKDASGAWFLMADIEHFLLEQQHSLNQLIQNEQNPSVHIKRYAFLSFHQSYGYEEFVEGLRPILNDTGQLSYRIVQGAFVQLCEQARQDPTQTYALFIDEINRANVSKVFGELLTLIEVNKRAGMAQHASVCLAYSGKEFSVPANVDIYATMNMADRSLTPLDMAFRRRFEFIAITPQPDLLPKDMAGIDMVALLGALNVRISAILGADYVLGHAPFMAVRDMADLNHVMKSHILPLLLEYSYQDWQQVRLILADDAKPVDTQFINQNTQAMSFADSFTNTDNMGMTMLKPVYHINQQILSFDQHSYLPIFAGFKDGK